MPGFQSDMQVEIGVAVPEDIPRIIELALNSLWREYKSYEEAEKAYRDQVAVRWREQLARGHARILVAKIHDVIVGFVVFRWWFGWNGWLESIVVDEKHRRKGIGSKLMQALLEKAKSEGYRAICFAVKPDGEDSVFWRRFGVQKFGEIQDTDLGEKLPLHYVGI